MHFTLRHLQTIQLTALASASLLSTAAGDYNPNHSNFDILSDASCPNRHSGRLSIDQCRGYVDCLNGFEIDRATCDDGKLYSMRSENCEDEAMAPSCPRGVNSASDHRDGDKTQCGEALCRSPDGECGILHQCLIDPCELTRCESNEVCEANYCGGCHAICTLRLNTVDQVMDDSTSTRPATTDAPRSTTSAEPTPDPHIHIADDGGIYVPESTSSPQVVHDGQDTVAPHSTTVAPTTTEETTDIPTTVAPKTTKQAAADPTSTNQVFVPSWTEHTCIAADPQEKNKSQRRLGSSWHSSFSTQYECCVNNFIYSLELFESCVGFDLELLEPKESEGKEYYPIWKEGKCQAVQGTEDGWLQTTFREKKYLCCFEYFKWQFDECLIR